MINYDATFELSWHELDKINGRLTWEEALCIQWIVKRLPPESKIVELGSFQGRSSIIIASVLSADSILCCIDKFSWSWDILNSFMKNIEEFKVNGKIRLLIMETAEAAEDAEDESIQMVFVNANNSYESVKQDILQWCPKIKTGGFIVCHTCPDYPGVSEAIEALQLNGVLISSSLWCGQKK